MQPFAYLLSLPGSRETERETLSLFFFRRRRRRRNGSGLVRSIETGTRRSIYFWHVFAYTGTRHSRDYTSALQISDCNAQPRPIICSLVQVEFLKRILSLGLLFPIKNSSKGVYLASTIWTNEENHDLQKFLERRVGCIFWNLNKGKGGWARNKKIRIFA